MENLNRIRKLAGLNESLSLTNLKLNAPRHKLWSNGPVPFSAILTQDGKPVGEAEVMVNAKAHPDAHHPEMIDIESMTISVNGKTVDPAKVDIPFNEIKNDLLDVIGDPHEWPNPNEPRIPGWRDDL